ncbi:OST2 [Candida margitis]|uniref:OST2 n=1 Tax=Candida margitis TaxID=1775924 RepID=UPI002227E919|nr:OST2 [Candida margitis]KAI5959665.1 OST2 [Candida margitis]
MAKKDSAIKKAQAATAAKANQSSSSTTTNSASSSGHDSIIPQTKSVTTTFHELQLAISTTTSDYFNNLTPKLKLIDLFLVFLVSLGILQFIYVLLIGNFPFNAFLGGFAICVGQFVLLVSLRLQINDSAENKGGNNARAKKSKKNEKVDTVDEIDEIDDDVEDDDSDDADAVDGGSGKSKKVFTGISPERSFADFIFASLILHFIVIHFIN